MCDLGQVSDITFGYGRPQKIFQGGNVDIVLIIFRLLTCNANGRSQNALPFLHSSTPQRKSPIKTRVPFPSFFKSYSGLIRVCHKGVLSVILLNSFAELAYIQYRYYCRGVTSLDGGRGKKQVWRPHIQTWNLSKTNLLYWSTCKIVWTFSAPGELCPPRYAPVLLWTAHNWVRIGL